jgi:hypothetical protein
VLVQQREQQVLVQEEQEQRQDLVKERWHLVFRTWLYSILYE